MGAIGKYGSFVNNILTTEYYNLLHFAILNYFHLTLLESNRKTEGGAVCQQDNPSDIDIHVYSRIKIPSYF